MAPKSSGDRAVPEAKRARVRTGADQAVPGPVGVELEQALDALSLRDFEAGGMRVTNEVPGKPGRPHVAAQDVIKIVTQTKPKNASKAWNKLKLEHPESSTDSRTFRFPGQRGSATEVVDIPTALRIIMVLPGQAAAKVRLKASVLLVRFLGGWGLHL